MKRSVLLTGATSGIGLATTRELSARGYDVFAGHRNPRDRAALGELAGVHPIQIDVSDPVSIQRAVLEIDDALGNDGLYAVINNAGITYSAPFQSAELGRAREVIDVNLIAPFLVTQRCLPLLRRYSESEPIKARVINIASWAAMMASPFLAFYNATKAGLVGLTESMYYDLGLLDIHAVLAVPGVTKTPLLAKTTDGAMVSLDAMSAKDRDYYRPYLEHFATMGERSGNARMLQTPEEAARKIAKIVDTRKPRFKYDLALDAKIVDGIVSRFVPFRVRAAMNRRMYQLDAQHGPPASVAVTAGAGTP